MGVGKATSYDLTQGLMLDIEDMIHLLSPTDTPLTGGVGADGRTVIPMGSAFEVQVQWQHEALLLPKSTLAAQVSNAATTLTLATGDGLKFSSGDIVIVEGEYMRITAGGVDTPTVTRSYAGSVAATHNTGVQVLNLGQALIEGSDPENARWQDRTGDYNYTQIFGPTAIQVSGTENVVRKYGLGGETEFQHQVANRTKEHWIQLEQAILYGVRNFDTTNRIRSMGGLAYYITVANGSVIDSVTTTFAESALLAMLQSCYDNGGSPDRALMGSKNKRLASGFCESNVLASGNAGVLQLMRPDNARGVVVDYYDSDFGRISMLLDRWVRTADVFVFEREQTQLASLRPLVFEMLAKTGDSMKGQIVAEKALKVRRYPHAGRFTALT